MSKELEDILKAARMSGLVHPGKPNEQYVNFRIFKELICRGAELIKVNSPHIGGGYLHKAWYERVIFISTTDEAVKRSLDISPHFYN